MISSKLVRSEKLKILLFFHVWGAIHEQISKPFIQPWYMILLFQMSTAYFTPHSQKPKQI